MIAPSLAPPASSRIPLTVIGGFLGAGKSTLLNRLLNQADGLRTAVLVNDFGQINVDATLVAAHDGETISLTNGCVCCSLGGGFTEALLQVMSRDPLPQWIVVEASGVSDPGRIAELGVADRRLRLEGVAVLADAARLQEQAADSRLSGTVQRQLAAASVIVLNKMDLADAQQLAGARRWLVQTCPGLPVINAVQADVPRALLIDDGPARGADSPPAPGDLHGHAHRHAHTHAHEHPPGDGHAHDHEAWPDHPFDTVSWTLDGIFDADRLKQAIKGLGREVIRLKGWVRTDRHGCTLVQYAGRRLMFEPREAPAGSPGQSSVLVCIGLRGALSPERLRAALDAALLTPAGASESPVLVLDDGIGQP